MNKVAAFALRRKNSILSMSEKVFCPPQPLRFWITPAYAGKRGSGSLPRSCRRDHPRVCGEKISQTRRNLPLGGSPPRVRGKRVGAARIGCGVGITPACAGKRAGPNNSLTGNQDHPRLCGEKRSGYPDALDKGGSPPRMRGKAQAEQPLPHVAGITPACAGKSVRRENSSS